MKFFWKAFLLYLIVQILVQLTLNHIIPGVSDIIVLLLCITLTVLLYNIFNKTEAKYQIINKKKIVSMVFLTFIIFIGYMVSEIGLASFLLPTNNKLNNYNIDNIGMAIAITFFYPIAEEFICRGIILNQLSRKYPFVIANIIQAIIFGIMHFNIYILLFSIGFGLIMGITKKYMNIYFAMMIHVLHNIFALVDNKFIIEFPNISLYSYLCIGIISLILTVYLLFKLKRHGEYWFFIRG